MGNIKETLIPLVQKEFKLAMMSFDLYGAVTPSDDSNKTKKDDSIEDEHKPKKGRTVTQVELESSTPPYEGTFEDFLEMFIQFGYVTLFSSAYPLAGLCALLNNMIEIRSDAFKLCFIHQRPFPERVQNIGCWQTAMEVMGFIAVMVNCGLIGLSGPVHRIFPNITGAQTVILIIVLEHMMLLVKLGISAAIPDVPHHVAVQLAKAEYKRRQLERKERKEQAARASSKETSSPETFSPENERCLPEKT